MMSKNNNGLTFSEDALSNRAIFLSGLNDINFYVEDCKKEYEYEEIFERLFGQTTNIFAIFPLGGKSAVINKHQSNDIMFDSNGKLNIFIVDGDFDNLWDDQKISSPNLIYLTRYNIESYYCNKEAVIKYIRKFLKLPRNKIEEKIKFDEWLQNFKQNAGELFVLFALLNRYQPTIPNVSLARKEFLDSAGHVPLEKLKTFKEIIFSKLENADSLIEEIHKKILSEFDRIEDEKILSIICGKYQIESLCRHIKTLCNRELDREDLRSTLISFFDIETLFFLKEQVLKLLSNNPPE